MKQKNNKAQVKSNFKGVQKANNNKQQMKKQNAAVVLAAAPFVGKINKNRKVPTKSKPPKIVKEEKEESDIDEDSGADLDAEETAAGAMDEESEEGSGVEIKSEPDTNDDEENDNNDEGSDEDGNDDDDDDDDDDGDDDDDENDDEPTEAPIEKNAVPKVGIPKIKTVDIPKDYPQENIIHVANLPKKGEFKQLDLVEVFSKYGTIDTIKPVYQKQGNSSRAFISYKTSEAAAAALAADKTKINGSTIRVTIKLPNKREQKTEEKKKEFEEKRKQMDEKKDCVVYVKNMSKETTENDIRQFFAKCGDIENLSLIFKKNFKFAFVAFSDPESAQAALKLHHSNLNGRTIGVCMKDDPASQNNKDPKRTICLKNLNRLDNFPVQTIEKIFGKCGEIEDIDLVCKKNILAFITFKNEASAKKAMKLSGSTHDDFKIEIGEFQLPQTTSNTVFMLNVKPGVEENDIREFFVNTGELANVFIKSGYAIVKFKETDSFCKSFLLNESELAGQSVFLEPYSEKKVAIMKKGHFENRKRPSYNKNRDNKKRKMNFNH